MTQDLLSEHLRINKQNVTKGELIGRGGWGEVYKGIWSREGKKPKIVAIKRILYENEKNLKEICTEVQLIHSLSAGFTCKVYGGCIVNEKTFWMILKYADGGDLNKFLSSPSTILSLSLQLSYCLQAAEAVYFLHCQEILHRDIKSYNFLLVKNNSKLILADFGTAKRNQNAAQSLVGTFAWMAPEIITETKPWSIKSDVYSLGMVMYEIVSMQQPYYGLSSVDIFSKIKGGEMPLIPSSCPKEFSTIIQRCWTLDPNMRPTSAEVVESLRELVLFVSVYEGDLSSLKLILNKGVNINTARQSDGVTPLILAAQNGHTNTVKELIQLGATLDLAMPDGVTPLSMAAQNGHTETVRELIQLGATVDISQKDGSTPLLVAVIHRHVETVRELINLGAKVNLGMPHNGSTPLITASKRGYTEIVRELIKLGASVDVTKYNGISALSSAAMNGYTETVRELVAQGANMEHKDNIHKVTAMYYAAYNGHTETVRVLAQLGAEVNTGHKISTPLSIAKFRKHTETAQELIKLGAKDSCIIS